MRLAPLVAALLAVASVAAVVASCGGPPPARRAEILPFIADDYPRALEEARARKLPIFVESWAPW